MKKPKETKEQLEKMVLNCEYGQFSTKVSKEGMKELRKMKQKVAEAEHEELTDTFDIEI